MGHQGLFLPARHTLFPLGFRLLHTRFLIIDLWLSGNLIVYKLLKFYFTDSSLESDRMYPQPQNLILQVESCMFWLNW